jgi:hypothetical protein
MVGTFLEMSNNGVQIILVKTRHHPYGEVTVRILTDHTGMRRWDLGFPLQVTEDLAKGDRPSSIASSHDKR